MRRRASGLLLGAGLLLPGCGQPAVDAGPDEPATMESIAGTEFSRITLSADAEKRLDIQTTGIRGLEGRLRLAIPYSAILYDAEGETWVYTQTEPLVFVRHAVTVDRVEGDEAVLHDGPPEGTLVVTVGSAELYGV
ncbi:MAG: hypothetical protein ACRDGV_10120, partial [Candidatus Limnocylindria bacterium]